MNKQHKLFSASSYDRGLEHLLLMWPEIKAKFPDATLDICYGWTLFAKTFRNNPERMAWMGEMEELMLQDGIVHHGRVGKKRLAMIRRRCGIWAYPTHFEEINCITALDAQHDGLVPVVMNYAALKETVGSGARVNGDIALDKDKKKYLGRLLVMMKDKDLYETERRKAIKFAEKYLWKTIAAEWLKQI